MLLSMISIFERNICRVQLLLNEFVCELLELLVVILNLLVDYLYLRFIVD